MRTFTVWAQTQSLEICKRKWNFHTLNKRFKKVFPILGLIKSVMKLERNQGWHWVIQGNWDHNKSYSQRSSYIKISCFTLWNITTLCSQHVCLVHIFSYNSSTSLQRNIKCHLELAVTNSLWGFNIYIQDISLEGKV